MLFFRTALVLPADTDFLRLIPVVESSMLADVLACPITVALLVTERVGVLEDGTPLILRRRDGGGDAG